MGRCTYVHNSLDSVNSLYIMDAGCVLCVAIFDVVQKDFLQIAADVGKRKHVML